MPAGISRIVLEHDKIISIGKKTHDGVNDKMWACWVFSRDNPA